MSTNRLIWSLVVCGLFFAIGKCQAQQTIAQIDSLLNRQRTDLSAKQAMALRIQLYKSSSDINYPIGIVRSLQFMAVTIFNADRYGKALKLLKKSEKNRPYIG